VQDHAPATGLDGLDLFNGHRRLVWPRQPAAHDQSVGSVVAGEEPELLDLSQPAAAPIDIEAFTAAQPIVAVGIGAGKANRRRHGRINLV
jgi:hypothetical protein